MTKILEVFGAVIAVCVSEVDFHSWKMPSVAKKELSQVNELANVFIYVGMQY